MRIQRSDERDSSWEQNRPRYRVYFFRDGDRPGRSWSVDTFDVEDAEVLETVAWAEREIGDEGLYAVALVGEHGTGPHSRGLVWLVGMDANDEPSNVTEEALLAAMHSRRGRTVVAG